MLCEIKTMCVKQLHQHKGGESPGTKEVGKVENIYKYSNAIFYFRKIYLQQASFSLFFPKEVKKTKLLM
ncbi:MAG: hypothetical protein D6730_06945 [Bacteroidetes bacterium]|nr:MAG: hypothetical protein D6730_06945 [Bacteroidota bacterium]